MTHLFYGQQDAKYRWPDSRCITCIFSIYAISWVEQAEVSDCLAKYPCHQLRAQVVARGQDEVSRLIKSG